MSHTLTRGTKSYKDAVQATKQIESLAVGFAKPNDCPTVSASSSALIIQNSTQLQLLVQITESLKDIQADLKIIIEQSKGGKSSVSLPDSLIEKLQNLSLGPSEKPKEKRGKL
ncbi:hypothetical protein ZIOFF_024830 [Zingiber officinale]|uniref:Uncharacterized protein n=1 Tax=Zingiber officinale TaxID=94328 RepID=A0A8J5L6H6_ZINOF|nr:hypothetical protein ZIOFF_024830 [Zingiber officinale]